jgi:hypothetical protein
MSGVVAAAVTFRLNIHRDERRFRRQRLEEVFVAFNGFSKQMGILWVTYVPVMTGKIDYNQALDMVIARGKDQECHFDKLQLLVALYWPELNAYVDRLVVLREKANSILALHKQRYLAGHNQDKESYDAISGTINDLAQLEKDFAAGARAEAGGLRGAG